MAFFSQRIRQKSRVILLAILLILLVIALIVSLGIKRQNQINLQLKIAERESYFQSKVADISAKSFLVYDIKENKIVFEKDRYLITPLASITKLMTALVALENLLATSSIQIRKDAISQEGDSGLLVGENWKIKDLSDFSLISSSNDGIYALAEALDKYENGSTTIDLMKDKAIRLGMASSSFLNTTGLDINESVSGSYSTASDLEKLLEYIFTNRPEMLMPTSEQSDILQSKNKINHRAINTNTAMGEIPTLIGSKTGFTDIAGGNVAIIFDAGFNHPVIVIILGSTQEQKFLDLVKLVKVTLEKLSESNSF